jgi:hypothetical protein
MDKKVRLERLARKLALVIKNDIEHHGDLKPSYMSPKFWVYIQREMQRFEDKKETESSD